LKYKAQITHYKPYGNDGMNGFGSNVKKSETPGMLAYFNFILSDEVITTTR